MKKKQLALLLIIGALVIAAAAIFIVPGNQRAQAAFLEKYGLAGMDTRQVVNALDSSLEDPSGLSASITGTELVLRDSKDSVSLALPEDAFYLSFAPYENSTHPCAIHSLSSCRGELVNATVHARLTDKDGNVIVDQELTTMDNGFVGLWLPRDIEGTLEVQYNNKTATAQISTFANSDTCLTTALKLN
ncbi:MAG: CueP family metal-binding protein [Anaerolineaceae bacterium]